MIGDFNHDNVISLADMIYLVSNINSLSSEFIIDTSQIYLHT